GLQVGGAIAAVHGGDELVGGDVRTGRRIWTDDRRMRDGEASELELACRVLHPASHARIVLRKYRDRQQLEQANHRHRPKTRWTDHWALLGESRFGLGLGKSWTWSRSRIAMSLPAAIHRTLD